MTIVVGYIPSPQGEAAFERAIIEAKRLDAKLVVVNTSKGDTPIDDRLIDNAEEEKLQEQLSAAGIEFEIVRSVRVNDPADEVLETAERVKAQLIVIGMRKRTPMGKFIMGSTAQRILLQAECPVLSVKAGSS